MLPYHMKSALAPPVAQAFLPVRDSRPTTNCTARRRVPCGCSCTGRLLPAPLTPGRRASVSLPSCHSRLFGISLPHYFLTSPLFLSPIESISSARICLTPKESISSMKHPRGWHLQISYPTHTSNRESCACNSHIKDNLYPVAQPINPLCKSAEPVDNYGLQLSPRLSPGSDRSRAQRGRTANG
jgi:hypothetical protein